MSCEEWAKVYESERGERPSEKVMRVVRHIDNVACMLREQGRKDSVDGHSPRPVGTFVKLAMDAFNHNIDEETARLFGEFWHDGYMDGYQMKGDVV